MILEDLVRVYGTARRLAEAIGCDDSQLSRWRKSGQVPAKWRPKLDELAKGLESPQDIDLDVEAACMTAASEAVVAIGKAWAIQHIYGIIFEAIAQVQAQGVDPLDTIALVHELERLALLRFGGGGNV